MARAYHTWILNNLSLSSANSVSPGMIQLPKHIKSLFNEVVPMKQENYVSNQTETKLPKRRSDQERPSIGPALGPSIDPLFRTKRYPRLQALKGRSPRDLWFRLSNRFPRRDGVSDGASEGAPTTCRHCCVMYLTCLASPMFGFQCHHWNHNLPVGRDLIFLRFW